MNAFLALPLEARVAIVFALGLVVGAAVNWAIYTLAWFARPVSPWSAPHADAPPRTWHDRLPVWGWIGLSREAGVHGSGFWFRPLVLELALAVGLAALYLWEIKGGLIPPVRGLVPPSSAALHWQYAAHAVLIALMTAATFIDFDEQTIPDSITLPGTLLGMAFAFFLPQSLLPIAVLLPGPVPAIGIGPLLVSSPDNFPPWLYQWQGLTLACLGVVSWCLALLPATYTLRRGWSKGLRYYFASVARGGAWRRMLALALLLCGGVAFAWWTGGLRWQSLITSIAGLAFGGGLIWAVRIVGTVALRKEAMGFGDVTLMAMIGAFLGWQPALMIFFLSPAAAVVIAVAQWAVTGRRDIAFGPYLCLAALFVIVRWVAVWEFASGIFAMGWLVVGLMAVCLLLMMGLLMMWRLIEQLLFGGERH